MRVRVYGAGHIHLHSAVWPPGKHVQLYVHCCASETDRQRVPFSQESTVERAAPTAEMNEFDLIKKSGAAIPLRLRCH